MYSNSTFRVRDWWGLHAHQTQLSITGHYYMLTFAPLNFLSCLYIQKSSTAVCFSNFSVFSFHLSNVINLNLNSFIFVQYQKVYDIKFYIFKINFKKDVMNLCKYFFCIQHVYRYIYMQDKSIFLFLLI